MMHKVTETIEIVDQGKWRKKDRFYWCINSRKGEMLCASVEYDTKIAAKRALLRCIEVIAKYVESNLKG